jgi:hypothetical protein
MLQRPLRACLLVTASALMQTLKRLYVQPWVSSALAQCDSCPNTLYTEGGGPMTLPPGAICRNPRGGFDMRLQTWATTSESFDTVAGLFDGL